MKLVEAGYFTKAHGVKGALVLKDKLDFDWEALSIIFIEISGNRAPFFISKINKANQGYIISLEDIDQLEKTNHLISKSVFIDESLVIEQTEETQWKNYQVIDSTFGDLGLVLSESNNGAQQIIEIKHGNKLILLPLVDVFIEKIDEDRKIIYYKSPQGLIDLYLDDNEEN
jgi:16S rRNA processing protein RimM